MLAGGKGTRLRPLTIHTPKPIVPIFERPFLHYQLDLLKQVPEIDEVILSLNYQPRRIEEIFGDGSAAGLNIRYVVEPAPLGTAGAVRYAGESLHESVVVFNGDVLTNVDLGDLLEEVELVMQERSLEDWDDGLRSVNRERPEARTLAPGEENRLHTNQECYHEGHCGQAV